MNISALIATLTGMQRMYGEVEVVVENAEFESLCPDLDIKAKEQAGSIIVIIREDM